MLAFKNGIDEIFAMKDILVALEYQAEKDLTESVDHDSSEFN